MASISKKQKLDDGEHREFERDPMEKEEIQTREMLIYIIPKKIPKARLQVLNNLARKKGFPITEQFR